MPKAPAWLASHDSGFWTIMTRFAAIISIAFPIATVVSVFFTGSLSTPTILLSAYLCILTTTLIIVMIQQERRHVNQAKEIQRRMQYGPAALPISQAYRSVDEASWNLFYGDRSKTAFREQLKYSLTFFAQAFSLITGTTCRASIKLIATAGHTEHEADIAVVTLCRSPDEQEKPRNRPDRIGGNTDYKRIFQEASPNYFCNDLPAQLSKGYQNSHWTEEVIANESFDYRSTIVWPIGTKQQILPGQSTTPPEIIGFLCVDALETAVFHQTYDVAIGESFSRALHLAIHHFRDNYSGNTATTTDKVEASNGTVERRSKDYYRGYHG